ncbi:TBC1 domain family member 19-like [Hyalella azteca]|uniref:TBC1 domain family member 19-like n=1 Tax=Hyalella azteca TaxID=294128 RepID=A0A979FM96_HYAAZ|nr:TBC1 domain family member 19-like [Hyalella azteca]
MQSNAAVVAALAAELQAADFYPPLLADVKVSWERRLVKCVNSMAAELGLPLARRRSEKERSAVADKWAELSTIDTDLSQIRPVYAPKDFLEVLASLRNPNYDESYEENLWGMIQLPIKVRDHKGLVGVLGELATCCHHLGLDENAPGELRPHLTLGAERLMLATQVVERNHGPLSRELLKHGCPVGLRGALWRQVLGVEIGPKQEEHFEHLRQLVLDHDLLVDRLVMKDVQLTASNDDEYFVFEDLLHQVLLCFSRDSAVLRHFDHSPASPALAAPQGASPTAYTLVAYPPAGVIPFHGFAMYAAPLTCVYEDPMPLYFTFREMYCRYWSLLHVISSHSQGAAALAMQFEQLLQSTERQLWYHCSALGINLCSIVFRWLVRAFSGYLRPDQLLQLWDAVLAYGTLEVLPVLALAIVSFRRQNLMDVTAQQAAEAVLADISNIQVVALLKLALSGDRTHDLDT